ncbi:MAG: hypothetical protein F4X19_09195 [Acidobacteria bacterium]|nr:hypothetical protein [Acidobacteriota bacterium]
MTSGPKRPVGWVAAAALAALSLNTACIPVGEDTIEVTASAYNSHPNQTDDTPYVAAWGDRLKPGMRAIAVSRDLIPMGFVRGARVRIEGFPGRRFVVLDKMHHRWRRRIDIYMGDDLEAAREWGKRRLRVHYFSSWIRKSARPDNR